MIYRKLTEEEQKLEKALDQHRDALKDEKSVLVLAVVLCSIGILMLLLSSNNSQPARVGNALLICGVICFVVKIALSSRTSKYRWAAKKLLDAYKRKNAVPFYQELTQMFAEEPGIHLHLNNNGNITVTDKRKKEEK